MLIVIDPNHGVPAYRQIVDQVRFQIAAGRLAAGAELPSTRALALTLGINPMTVSKAYGLLEAEGLVRHRPGLPLTVAPRPRGVAEREREDELRELLAPAAIAARQLGVSPTRAAAVFRQLVSESPDAEEHES